jgi:transcriptional regulator with XRE-family HTH domain
LAASLGRRLRARRAAHDETLAAVATRAGLSVPYIANLENGRGNPTVAALGQLAAAHGMRLAISLVPAADAADGDAADGDAAGPGAGGVPASLVRLGRTDRFRRTARQMAGPLGADEAEVSAQLVSVLAAIATTLRRDLAEADWWRLLDALLLVAASPAAG